MEQGRFAVNQNGDTMSKIIVVTSGKGGVGKTTTSASLATGLALAGFKTVVIDFDIGLRNLDLIMGCERRVVYDIVNVIHGDANIHQALIRDKKIQNLYILEASQTRDKDALEKDGVKKILDSLSETFDYIVCDSPAGIEKGALMAMYYADIAIVVANPEVSSVRDSDRILGILSSKTQKAERGESLEEFLIVTRFAKKRASSGDMMTVETVQELLGIPLLGIIPESSSVLTASNSGEPVILDQKSDAGRAYQNIVSKFLGTPEKPKRGFFKRLLRSKEVVTA